MTTLAHEYRGSCSCGGTTLCLRSRRSPADFEPRSDAETCEFCRRNDGVWISDPEGELWIPESNRTRVERFASGSVAFHFCSGCEELTYAWYPDAVDGPRVAVARLRLFAALRGLTQPLLRTNFEGAKSEQAAARRLRHWTPVVHAS